MSAGARQHSMICQLDSAALSADTGPSSVKTQYHWRARLTDVRAATWLSRLMHFLMLPVHHTLSTIHHSLTVAPTPVTIDSLALSFTCDPPPCAQSTSSDTHLIQTPETIVLTTWQFKRLKQFWLTWSSFSRVPKSTPECLGYSELNPVNQSHAPSLA